MFLKLIERVIHILLFYHLCHSLKKKTAKISTIYQDIVLALQNPTPKYTFSEKNLVFSLKELA
jgi:hypothetical protein